MSERQNKYYRRHRKKILVRRKAYATAYFQRPEVKKMREGYDRMRRLNITQAEFDAQLLRQHNVCGLCGEPFDSDDTKMKPCADHDHATGKLRGILHRHCNLGLGNLNDDVVMVAKAVRYLLQFISSEDANV